MYMNLVAVSEYVEMYNCIIYKWFIEKYDYLHV